MSHTSVMFTKKTNQTTTHSTSASAPPTLKCPQLFWAPWELLSCSQTWLPLPGGTRHEPPPCPGPCSHVLGVAETLAEGVIHAWSWPSLATWPHSPGSVLLLASIKLLVSSLTTCLSPGDLSVPPAGRSLVGLPCYSLEGPRPAGFGCHRQASPEPPEPLRHLAPTLPPQGT